MSLRSERVSPAFLVLALLPRWRMTTGRCCHGMFSMSIGTSLCWTMCRLSSMAAACWLTMSSNSPTGHIAAMVPFHV
eukprot:6070501-Heterocapsa_arctica.AAC.1